MRSFFITVGMFAMFALFVFSTVVGLEGWMDNRLENHNNNATIVREVPQETCTESGCIIPSITVERGN